MDTCENYGQALVGGSLVGAAFAPPTAPQASSTVAGASSEEVVE